MQRLPVLSARKPPTPYLYLISEPHGAFKIGHAFDVEARLITLQCSTPYELKIVHKVQRVDAIIAEAALHCILAKYHLRGEWFQLPGAGIPMFNAALRRYEQSRDAKLPPKPPDYSAYNDEIQAQLNTKDSH